MCRTTQARSSSSFAADRVSPQKLHSMTRMAASSSLGAQATAARTCDTACVAWVEREDGVRLYWEERGEGPSVLVMHGYIQHPEVLGRVMDELATDHRIVRFDIRGAGQSTRTGPYD